MSVHPAGEQPVDGRPAQVYALDWTQADSGEEVLAGLPVVTDVSGSVWIEVETGALLKAEVDYWVTTAGGGLARTAGHLTFALGRIGEVSVEVP